MKKNEGLGVQGKLLIRQDAVLELTSMKACTLRAAIKDRGFPPPLKITSRLNAWRVKDVVRWIEQTEAV